MTTLKTSQPPSLKVFFCSFYSWLLISSLRYDPVCTVILFQLSPEVLPALRCAEWGRPELTTLLREATLTTTLTSTISYRAVLDWWVTFLAKICEDPGLQANCKQNCSQTLAAAYQNKTFKWLRDPYTYNPWYTQKTSLAFYSSGWIVEPCPLGTGIVNSCTPRIWDLPKVIALNLSQGYLSLQDSLSMGKAQIFKTGHQPSERYHHPIFHIYSESGHQICSHC